jgi:hypothetical protein
MFSAYGNNTYGKETASSDIYIARSTAVSNRA